MTGTYMSRTNKTKAKLKAGRSCFGVVMRFAADEAVEMAGVAGCDFVIIDVEHEPINVHDAARMVRVTALMGMTPIVRLGRSWLPVIDPLLAAGAQGFSLARVRSTADIDALAASVYYHPVGERTVYALGAAGNFGHQIDEEEWATKVNPEIMIQPIIEEAAAIEHIDAIVSHPLVDVVECGAKDLRQSMGMRDMTEIKRIVSDVFNRAAANGKGTAHSVLGHLADPAGYPPVAKGAPAMFIASPTGIIMSSLASMTAAFRAQEAS